MDEHSILVAFDGSDNAVRAVEYAAGIASRCQGFKVGLLYVERLPNRDRFADEEAWEKRCKENEADIRRALEDARKLLAGQGVDEGAATEHYLKSCNSPTAQDPDQEMCSLGTSIALDILHTRRELGYGAIVIGRRGVSRTEEFLFGSVSNKIIHAAKDCAVWIVA